LPSWFFGVLLGRVIRRLAEKERVKALAASSVKIHGNDVLASFKIVYGFGIFSLVSVLLGVLVMIYSYCKRFLDYFESLVYTVYAVSAFSLFWPFYMYLSLILSDRAMNNFKKLYVRVLSICSPVGLENARSLRQEIKQTVKDLVKKYTPLIFPDMKSKKPAKKIDFNDTINDAFGLLSEIGLN
jgi:glycerol-3-phosphate O-acyltransferase/dihydroxyacetone phosphate acyltransferase